MDPDMLFAIVGTIVIVAIVMGVTNSMFHRWLRHREKMTGLAAEKTAERAAQYAARSERLEQRVRVLERIATDRGADLATQIEDLRDPAEAGTGDKAVN